MLGIVTLPLLCKFCLLPLAPSRSELPRLSLNHPGTPLFLPLALSSTNMLICSKLQERASPTSLKFSLPVLKNPLRRSLRSPPLKQWIFNQGSRLDMTITESKSLDRGRQEMRSTEIEENGVEVLTERGVKPRTVGWVLTLAD